MLSFRKDVSFLGRLFTFVDEEVLRQHEHRWHSCVLSLYHRWILRDPHLSSLLLRSWVSPLNDAFTLLLFDIREYYMQLPQFMEYKASFTHTWQ